MALKTKIKLQVRHDYKQIDVASMTGTGITGYGANQDPVGYRPLANGTNTPATIGIKGGIYIVTSPSGQITKLPINPFDAYNSALNYAEFINSVNNVQLGYSVDDQLEDGLWKVEYVEFSRNNTAGGVTIGWSADPKDTYFTYYLSDFLSFKNASYIYLENAFPTPATNLTYTKLYQASALPSVSNVDPDSPTTKRKIDVTSDIIQTPYPSTNYSDYLIGYSSTKYIPVAKAIKECLDNKVADLVECECDEVDAELVNKYLLYDAMFINCELDNINKAQQIFDLLSKYCDDNCGCD
jgi:hypothetical protein